MGSTTFNGMYVLALEWVNAKYRVMGSMILSLSFPIGEMILGVVAMYIHDFRILIRVLYSPGLIIIIYLWLIPESVRWLLVNGQVDRAIKILKRMARVNGKQLSDKTIEMLKLSHANKTPEQNNLDKQSMWQSLKSILKSKTLIMRFVSCCYQWMCCSFCYYGLSMIAIHIPGENRYISFIYVVAIEIPGLLISFPLLNKLKRKPLMIGSLLLTALSTIATSWISREHSTLILIFCMLGKAAITCAYNVVYIFTAEQWPTNIRATTMFSCSMIAKAGAMVAPMTAILVSTIFKILISISKMKFLWFYCLLRPPNMIHCRRYYLPALPCSEQFQCFCVQKLSQKNYLIQLKRREIWNRSDQFIGVLRVTKQRWFFYK